MNKKIILFFLMFISIVGCTKSPTQMPTNESELISLILQYGKAKDVNGLISLTVNPTNPQDLEKVTQKLRTFGWKPKADSDPRKDYEEWLSSTKKDISVFLDSYGSFFNDFGSGHQEYRVISAQIDTSKGVVDTPQGEKSFSEVYGHLEPYKVVIWGEKEMVIKELLFQKFIK